MAGIRTFRDMIADEYTLTVYCGDQGCRHSAKLDLQTLAERLGMDFVTVGDPNPLVARLRCGRCKGKNLSLIMSPRSHPATGAGHSLS